MSRQRFFAVLVIGMAGAAAFGVITAEGQQAQAYGEELQRFERLTQLIPMYPDAFLYPLGEDLHVDGHEREMAYAITKDPTWKVADRYQGIWETQGFKVRRRNVGGEEWVTASDVNDPWLRTVVATRQGGRTVILASVREWLTEPAPPKVPVPAACDVISHTGARDDGVGTEVVFLACESYLSELLDFYDDALYGTDRKVRVRDGAAQRLVYVTYSGQALEVSVAAEQSDTEPPRTVATVTWQQRRRRP